MNDKNSTGYSLTSTYSSRDWREQIGDWEFITFLTCPTVEVINCIPNISWDDIMDTVINKRSEAYKILADYE